MIGHFDRLIVQFVNWLLMETRPILWFTRLLWQGIQGIFTRETSFYQFIFDHRIYKWSIRRIRSPAYVASIHFPFCLWFSHNCGKSTYTFENRFFFFYRIELQEWSFHSIPSNETHCISYCNNVIDFHALSIQIYQTTSYILFTISMKCFWWFRIKKL